MSDIVKLPNGHIVVREYKNQKMTFRFDQSTNKWHWEFTVHIKMENTFEGNAESLGDAIAAAQKEIDKISPEPLNVATS